MDLNGATLLRRWRTIAVVAALGAVLALLATFVLPQKYQATTSLLIRAENVRIFSGNGQPAVGPNDYSQTTALVKTIDETQAAMLSSRAVAESVVRQLHLDQPKPPANWFAALKSFARTVLVVVWDIARYGYYKQPGPFEGAVENVQHSLTAQPIQDSYLLNVQATAGDPQDAANIANAAAAAFIQYSQQVYGQEAKTHAEFIKSEVQRSQQSVTMAAANLSQYKKEHNLPSLDNQLQLDVTTANTAKTTLQTNREELAAAKARLQRIDQQIAKITPTIEETQNQSGRATSSTQGGNQTVAQTGTQHSSGQTSQSTDSQTSKVVGHGTSSSAPNAPAASTNPTTPPSLPAGRFGASNGTSNQSSTSNGTSTTRTTTSPSDVTTSSTQKVTISPSSTDQQSTATQVTTKVNPVYQGLVEAQQKAAQDIAALEAENAMLAKAVSQAETALNIFPAAQSELTQLQLQLDAANNTYLKLRGEYEDALITEAQSVNDMTVVDRAVPPLYPAKPLKFLYALLGLGVGVVAGVGVSLWQEYWTQTHPAKIAAPRPTPGRSVPEIGAAFTKDGGVA